MKSTSGSKTKSSSVLVTRKEFPRGVKRFIRRQKAVIRRRYSSAIEKEKAIQELLQKFGINK
jgi:hypothetical protein